MNKKVSIGHIVREYVAVRPCLQEALKQGILNYSAVARKISNELREEKNIIVNIPAAKMALLRLADKLQLTTRGLEEKILHILAESSLQIINDVTVVTAGDEIDIPKVYELARENRARFIQSTRSLHTVTLMIDQGLLKKIRESFTFTPIKIMRDQTAIIITSPLEIVETPGVVAYIMSSLAYNGINVTQFISCHTDTILIIDRKDALRAYSILEKLILKARKKSIKDSS